MRLLGPILTSPQALVRAHATQEALSSSCVCFPDVTSSEFLSVCTLGLPQTSSETHMPNLLNPAPVLQDQSQAVEYTVENSGTNSVSNVLIHLLVYFSQLH